MLVRPCSALASSPRPAETHHSRTVTGHVILSSQISEGGSVKEVGTS